MADYSIRNRVARQRVYTLQTPSNAVEVEKMLRSAYQDCLRMYKKRGGLSDDTIRVETDDDSISLIFDIPDGAALTADEEPEPEPGPDTETKDRDKDKGN